MKTVSVIRRSRNALPAVAAVSAFALLGANAALAGADPTRMQEQIEISQHRNAERQERQQQREQPRPPREQAPPRSQPERPDGGNFAGAPRPPRDDRGNGGGNANYNRPPPPGVGRPGYGPGYGPGHRPQPPRHVPRLPPGHARHYWNGSPYYYSSGYWYRPFGSSYAIVTAPYGLFMPYLPTTYSTFWYGSSRYYMSDNTYFLYDNSRRGYVVTQSPYGVDSQQGMGGSAADDQLYVYPARGQSEQQTADDRYECHRWAVDQTGFDPVESSYDADRREEYLRAITACLTGRGYTVR